MTGDRRQCASLIINDCLLLWSIRTGSGVLLSRWKPDSPQLQLRGNEPGVPAARSTKGTERLVPHLLKRKTKERKEEKKKKGRKEGRFLRIILTWEMLIGVTNPFRSINMNRMISINRLRSQRESGISDTVRFWIDVRTPTSFPTHRQ